MPRRKETETVQIGLRVKESLRTTLDQAAEQHGISMNAEIVQRLENSFRQEQQFGDVDMSRMAFDLAAHFAVAVLDKDWRVDPMSYVEGAVAVLAELIRRVPHGAERNLAIQGIVSHLLTVLAQENLRLAEEKEQDK